MKQRRVIIDVALYLIVFVLIQFAVNMAAVFICHTHKFTAVVTAATTIVCSLLTIALFAWRKWTPMNGNYINRRPWFTLFWVICLAVGTIAPSSYLTELLKIELPADYEKLFSGIMGSDLGYMAVGVLAPIAEEIVFRGAILRRLADAMGHRRRWVAITLTALLFGIVHNNMAQGLNAFIIGLMLGWMYVRTGSIVPGIVFHWANNSIAFLLYRSMPQCSDMTITEYFHGDMKYIAILIVSSLLIFGAALYQLEYRLGKD